MAACTSITEGCASEPPATNQLDSKSPPAVTAVTSGSAVTRDWAAVMSSTTATHRSSLRRPGRSAESALTTSIAQRSPDGRAGQGSPSSGASPRSMPARPRSPDLSRSKTPKATDRSQTASASVAAPSAAETAVCHSGSIETMLASEPSRPGNSPSFSRAPDASRRFRPTCKASMRARRVALRCSAARSAARNRSSSDSAAAWASAARSYPVSKSDSPSVTPVSRVSSWVNWRSASSARATASVRRARSLASSSLPASRRDRNESTCPVNLARPSRRSATARSWDA